MKGGPKSSLGLFLLRALHMYTCCSITNICIYRRGRWQSVGRGVQKRQDIALSLTSVPTGGEGEGTLQPQGGWEAGRDGANRVSTIRGGWRRQIVA